MSHQSLQSKHIMTCIYQWNEQSKGKHNDTSINSMMEMRITKKLEGEQKQSVKLEHDIFIDRQKTKQQTEEMADQSYTWAIKSILEHDFVHHKLETALAKWLLDHYMWASEQNRVQGNITVLYVWSLNQNLAWRRFLIIIDTFQRRVRHRTRSHHPMH